MSCTCYDCMTSFLVKILTVHQFQFLIVHSAEGVLLNVRFVLKPCAYRQHVRQWQKCITILKKNAPFGKLGDQNFANMFQIFILESSAHVK